jgi:hypothetical protein
MSNPMAQLIFTVVTPELLLDSKRSRFAVVTPTELRLLITPNFICVHSEFLLRCVPCYEY